MTKPTKPTVPPAPSRANPGPVFSETADTFAAFQAPFADYLDDVADFVDDRADAALAAALAGDLPPLPGTALNMLRVNAGATAAEFRTPAQVLVDLGISGHGPTGVIVTNVNTIEIGGTYLAVDTSTGLPVAEWCVVSHYPGDTIGNSVQEAFSLISDRRWWRREIGGSWQNWVEVQPALGFTPVEQGGGSFMGANKVYIGWDGGISGIRAQVDAEKLGGIVTNISSANEVAICQLFAPGTAPLYACRAWVNFNGTAGARASGNVSSVVRNGVGDYTINFITAMPDANYAAVFACTNELNLQHGVGFIHSQTASSVRIQFYSAGNSAATVDKSIVNVAIFR